ncbi:MULTISPECIES: hypothetical protein [Xenorhabdus]|uniref:hypothetical protein n=1 Tax=Xenorhabdus TaxID=626 RepID=UPI00064B2C2C|nr:MULTISPECIES: hypothetical protein [Xenorhabdus]KLU14271.1 hypothetical protein AAY47_17405 [Xenorhabdus griffiniae]KOP34782.1 hypothetical protein AFK69_02810 [Xenorhabdus sp. GDc328]
MSQGTATSTFTVGIQYDTETLSPLESQPEHIAELLDRIDGRREAGMKLSTDNNAKAGVTADSFKVFNVASGVTYLGSAVIDATKLNKAHDDHLRYIIREEIRQFVAHESERGGLFSKW